MPTSHSDKVLAAVYDNTPVPIAMSATTRPTPLLIVASPRSQCGKTFLARLLVDYLRLDGGAVSAFDLNPDDFPARGFAAGGDGAMRDCDHAGGSRHVRSARGQ